MTERRAIEQEGIRFMDIWWREIIMMERNTDVVLFIEIKMEYYYNYMANRDYSNDITVLCHFRFKTFVTRILVVTKITFGRTN